MDPLTHALAGIAVGGLSNPSADWFSSAAVASMVGGLLPDADIVYQLGGDANYLKHHRGFSHSLIGVGLLSLPVGFLLHFIYSAVPVQMLVYWTLLGCLSHLFLDVFNSCGAELLWPLHRRKLSCGVLTLIDPVIILLIILGLWYNRLPMNLIAGLVLGYIGLRIVTRELIRFNLKRKYGSGARIAVFPSQLGLICWDFIIETKKEQIVGYCRPYPYRVGTRRRLKRAAANPVIDLAKQTELGQMFCSFSPFVHIDYTRSEDKHVVSFLDLRYFLKNDFMHSATVVFDASMELLDSILHPYSKKRQVKISA